MTDLYQQALEGKAALEECQRKVARARDLLDRLDLFDDPTELLKELLEVQETLGRLLKQARELGF